MFQIIGTRLFVDFCILKRVDNYLVVFHRSRRYYKFLINIRYHNQIFFSVSLSCNPKVSQKKILKEVTDG